MKLNKFTPKKNAAQAIVEFAIVLPLLLLLLYGLLEAGRLLFMYSTIVTASRQAVRYGSATGEGSSTGVKRYNDCAGIRLAANNVDYLNAFNHTGTDVNIQHDAGTSGSVTTNYCQPGVSSETWTPPDNNQRMVVTVTGHFTALVPKLVPFLTRNITATSRRTILVSISIAASSGGSGGAAPAGALTSSLPQAEPSQTVTFTYTLTSASGTPTGSVTFTLINASGISTVMCGNVTLSGGVATCTTTIPNTGTYTVKADYLPDSGSFTARNDTITGYKVDFSSTSVIVTDVPDPSVVNNAVIINVQVTNTSGTGTIPTGTVTVTTAAGNCTITLTNGLGSCSKVFTAVGNSTITAAYSGDATHYGSSGTSPHEVMSGTATPSNTPKPATSTPTSTPTLTPTIAATPVSNCNTIRDAVNAKSKPITTSGYTMTMDIPNNNSYPVTIGSVFVAWNYSAGHSSGDTSLWLQSADLDGDEFWTGNLNAPNTTITPSITLVIPAHTTSTLTFTFDKTYNRESGEQIRVYFSTPGCESYPIIVPSTSANLRTQLIAAGTDNNQQSQFNLQVQNIGSSAASNISVRIYFTLDGSNAASNYTLEKYWDQSGVATITGPTSVSGSTYYFTVSFGSTSLAAGSTWQFNSALHLSNWDTTYSGTNDFWHTTGSLPSSFTNWPTIPIYVGGSSVWGSTP